MIRLFAKVQVVIKWLWKCNAVYVVCMFVQFNIFWKFKVVY